MYKNLLQKCIWLFAVSYPLIIMNALLFMNRTNLYHFCLPSLLIFFDFFHNGASNCAMFPNNFFSAPLFHPPPPPPPPLPPNLSNRCCYGFSIAKPWRVRVFMRGFAMHAPPGFADILGRFVYMCCRVLQYDAVCCSVLQCVAVTQTALTHAHHRALPTF